MKFITEQELTHHFSRNLKRLRRLQAPPVSQRHLAGRLHVDRATIANYESGRLLPSLCLACNIARYFDISLETLLSDNVSCTRKEESA